MRPDVTLVTPYPRSGRRHDGESGVWSYSANLARSLRGAGAAVQVVAPQLEGEPTVSTDDGVRVLRAFRTGAPGSVAEALRAAERTGAPVVHLQHELFLYAGAAGIPGTVAALARGRRGSRAAHVVTLHQVIRPQAIDRAFVRMHRIGAPVTAARLGISATQRGIARWSGAVIVHEPAFAAVVPRSTVIPHGIEIPDAAPLSRSAARHRLGIEDPRPIVLCFGFLAPYKGLETVLRAVAPVRDRVHLVIAGGEHPRLTGRGESYGEQLRREHAGVATFTGFVPDDQVADWFAAADVAVQCYPEPHASSGPLALALAHRTPVLLSQRLAETVGAAADLAVGPDPGRWTERLLDVVSDPVVRERTALASAALAADRSWPAVARRHLTLYREVVTHAHGRAAAALVTP